MDLIEIKIDLFVASLQVCLKKKKKAKKKLKLQQKMRNLLF
jgi:hypothetical protein